MSMEWQIIAKYISQTLLIHWNLVLFLFNTFIAQVICGKKVIIFASNLEIKRSWGRQSQVLD